MVSGDVPDWQTQNTPAPPTPATSTYTTAAIAVSASGASTIVAAVTAKQIVVVAMSLIASAAVNVKAQSHTTPTDLTGLWYLAANGGLVLPFNQGGWFASKVGEALDLNLSGAVPCGGSITYTTQ